MKYSIVFLEDQFALAKYMIHSDPLDAQLFIKNKKTTNPIRNYLFLNGIQLKEKSPTDITEEMFNYIEKL